jgi:hypothetical protein
MSDANMNILSDKMKDLDMDDEEQLEYIIYDKVVLCIDVGILNLGISVGLIDEQFNLKEIAYVDLIDITKFTHTHELEGKECNLHHGKNIADWMEHMFQEHLPLFQECDYILVEKQPPIGLVSIEQLIYYRWRDKCHLISPRSMHKHYNIGQFEYEQRKLQTMHIAESILYWSQRAIQKYETLERKHDIADSICLMEFWLHKNKINYLEQKRIEKINKIQLTLNGMTLHDWFEQFRYVQ